MTLKLKQFEELEAAELEALKLNKGFHKYIKFKSFMASDAP